MENQEQQPKTVRPRTFGQWCAYLIALAIVGIIDFVDAVPYHTRYYLWCAWYYTGGQIRLLFMSWRLRLEQRHIRQSNPYYCKNQSVKKGHS